MSEPRKRSSWRTQRVLAIVAGVIAAFEFAIAIAGWGANLPGFYATVGVVLLLVALGYALAAHRGFTVERRRKPRS